MDELPVRHLSRLGGEMHLSGIEALQVLSPGMDEEGVVALVALRVCLPDWTRGERPATPADIRHATTLRALARSLDWPLGSTHAMAKRLIDDGLFVRTPRGLAIAPAASDRVVAYLEIVHDLMLRFAADVCAAGVLRPQRTAASCPLGTLMAVALDVMLMPFETFRGRVGDWTALKLWLGVSTLAVQHIVRDPELSARHAVASTPDRERRAVSATRVRAVTHVGLATAWRRLRAMEAAGVLAQRDGGWLVRSDQLLEAEMEASVRAAITYYLRRLNELVIAGLDPAHPRYINGRPPWAGDA